MAAEGLTFLCSCNRKRMHALRHAQRIPATLAIMAKTRETLHFGDFELDVAAYELRRNGRAVRLERHPMDLLLLLIERRNDLVSRAEIVELLWGKDVFVDVETGVHTAIRKIRQALRDSPETPTFIETVPGRGYRFIATVEVVGKSADVTPAAQVAPPVVASAPEPPQSPGEHARRRFPLFAALLAVALIGAAGLVWWNRSGASALSPRITLAVLPFENIGNDPERQYLADGLTEETGASLARIDPERLSVKGRTLRYKGTTKSAAEIGQELAVDYLLESTIQSEGNDLRVTAKLIRVRDQEHVWTQSYDQSPTNLLGLQRQMSAAIAEQIRLRLSPAQLDAVTRRQPQSADAYDLYLRGRNFTNQRTQATSRRAIDTTSGRRPSTRTTRWPGLAFHTLWRRARSIAMPRRRPSPRAPARRRCGQCVPIRRAPRRSSHSLTSSGCSSGTGRRPNKACAPRSSSTPSSRWRTSRLGICSRSAAITPRGAG